MKHYGCILEFTEQRNGELMRAYKEIISKTNHVSIPQLAQQIVQTPCSRFWVSEERANVVLAALIRGNTTILNNMRQSKRDMFKEIYRRYKQEKQKHPNEKNTNIISRIVYTPAPSFYMGARSAMEVIYRIKKNRKNNDKSN